MLSQNEYNFNTQIISPRERGGVPLGILGAGVPPGSSNPDPISHQKIYIYSIYPFSDQNGAKPYPMGRHIPVRLI